MANRTQLQMVLDRIQGKWNSETEAFRTSKQSQIGDITKEMERQKELDISDATKALEKFAARQGFSTSRENIVGYTGEYDGSCFKLKPSPAYRKLKAKLEAAKAIREKGVQEIATKYQKLIDTITVDGLTPEHKETVKKLLGQ